MSNTKIIIVTSGFISQKDDRFLMAKRSDNDSYFPGYWELPGGKHEIGEEINLSCQREIKEECGIDIEAKEILAYRSYFLSEKQTQYVELFFRCIPKNIGIKLSHEHSDFKWVTFEQAYMLGITDYTKNVLKEIQKHTNNE